MCKQKTKWVDRWGGIDRLDEQARRWVHRSERWKGRQTENSIQHNRLLLRVREK